VIGVPHARAAPRPSAGPRATMPGAIRQYGVRCHHFASIAGDNAGLKSGVIHVIARSPTSAKAGGLS